MENYKTITVLDYSTGKVTQYNLSEWNHDGESFVSMQGHKISECHWMIHEDATIYQKNIIFSKM
tara:strand:+ start:311 stop:502 length:192 start_codon:yes stop_codon:yes gene_type:complete